jgi:hypothetical protein
MGFEWDEDKPLTNLRKHDVDFVDVRSIFDRHTIVVSCSTFKVYPPLVFSPRGFANDSAQPTGLKKSNVQFRCSTDANKAYSIGN